MVFNCIIGPSLDQIRDFGPFVSNLLTRGMDDPILVNRPIRFFDSRIQMIVPPLATLLANASCFVD